MSDYRQMWSELEMDLEPHDNLLKALSEIYQSVYLSQRNRPSAMSYFDFVISEIHGLRVKELVQHRAGGSKVFGAFCVYVPEEIILAAGGICIGLCAGADMSTSSAEQILPRNICPLIKSAFGFKLERICPYFQVCDLVIGETTCDGKKKAWEILASYAPVYVMELPQCKDEKDRNLWRSEIFAFKQKVEEITGKKVTAPELAEAATLLNARRASLQRLYDLRKADPVPLSGLDALLAVQVSFYDDPIRFTQQVNALCDEVETRVKEKTGVFPSGTPRVLIAGSPVVIPNWKIHSIIESSGAAVVCEESCTGTRLLTGDTVINKEDLDAQVAAIAERQLRTNCACFTPNRERIEDILNLCEKYAVDGVIYYSLLFCQPYLMEAVKVKEALERKNIPVLMLESDYGSGDVEQIRTRVQAFIEMISGR
ncbi:MAG: 2-hydroxyacyl-CoA dehydratase [Peptococcaceae bacterium]|nr:MAG: 2-hydroxyacyl-CoA dehydratase [Peptococcaceae bacterium]